MERKIGLPPGSVVFTGAQKVEQVQVHHLRFNSQIIEEKVHSKRVIYSPTTTEENDVIEWFDIRGLHDTALIEQIGTTFDIHGLVLENIVDVEQRPKFEEHETGIFILLKALRFNEVNSEIEREQVSLYFNQNFVLSLQEKSDDLFHHIRKRLHTAKGKIRTRGSDYLAYALLDSIIDHYYVVIDKMENQIERLELEIQESVQTSSKDNIYALKRQLLAMRKDIVPLRDVLGRLHRSDSLLLDSSDIFMRDLHNQILQIIDSLDSHRDTLNGLHDMYLTEISFQQNKVMQLLTVVTTIFVPLSFLAGLYGMNFDHMPELHYRNAYFMLIGIMFLIFVSGLYYFKRQNWL